MDMTELGIHHLGLFVLAGWALNLTPGPDVFYMVAHALKGGWRAGTVAMLGICAGCTVHVAAAALGVSALVAASATAFTVLKWVGAAYLCWVGVQMLRAKAPADAPDLIAAHARQERAWSPFGSKNGLWGIFVQGFWTNVLNPKVALFFLAFLPQFIEPGIAHPAWAFSVLGLLFIVNSVPVNMGYVLLASWVSRRAGALRRGFVWLERAAGALFIGFGLKLAFTDNPR